MGLDDRMSRFYAVLWHKISHCPFLPMELQSFSIVKKKGWLSNYE